MLIKQLEPSRRPKRKPLVDQLQAVDPPATLLDKALQVIDLEYRALVQPLYTPSPNDSAQFVKVHGMGALIHGYKSGLYTVDGIVGPAYEPIDTYKLSEMLDPVTRLFPVSRIDYYNDILLMVLDLNESIQAPHGVRTHLLIWKGVSGKKGMYCALAFPHPVTKATIVYSPASSPVLVHTKRSIEDFDADKLNQHISSMLSKTMVNIRLATKRELSLAEASSITARIYLSTKKSVFSESRHSSSRAGISAHHRDLAMALYGLGGPTAWNLLCAICEVEDFRPGSKHPVHGLYGRRSSKKYAAARILLLQV